MGHEFLDGKDESRSPLGPGKETCRSVKVRLQLSCARSMILKFSAEKASSLNNCQRVFFNLRCLLAR